jgi:AcrR family transcriptional regulator
MTSKDKALKGRILTAAAAQLCRLGANRVTLESVAAEAGCAKGLVHYHYRSKSKLVAAALERVLEERDRRWSAARQAASPETWVGRTWDLITVDASSGLSRAIHSVLSQDDDLTVQTAKSAMRRFRETFAVGLTWFLASQGLRPAVPIEELSGLASATVLGMIAELSAGASVQEVEAAYAALWLGLLSATRAATE